MKFRKHLSVSIERIFPDWGDKFLSYKNLKKQLKRIYPCDGRLRRDDEKEVVVVEQEVNYFMEMLDKEIDKFNDFFLDKEQDYVIKMTVLKERVEKMTGTPLELLEVGRQIVEFHGEMVLLENYSLLNYTGLVKILKKHDKRSGALIRKPFIHNVLHQPFFKTDVVNNLVNECERMVDQLFSSNPTTVPSPQGNGDPENEDHGVSVGAGGPEERLHRAPEELDEIRNMENKYVRHTVSALRVLNNIRISSPVSEFSWPPPMHGEDVQDILGDPTTIIEQAAE